jgi:hypothetical protein
VSYAQPQQRRPAAVTVASYLLVLVAVLIVVSALITVATLGSYSDAIRNAVAAQGVADAARIADQITGFFRVAAVIGLVVNLLLAGGFVALALLDLRGKNPARIVTWVLAGLGVLCLGCSTASSASGAFTGGFTSNSANGVNASEVQRQIRESIPSWLTPLETTLAVVNLLALIVVIILLALPASNAFFRPAEPVGPEPGYPAYPGYPPAGSPPPPPYGTEPPHGGQPPSSGPPSA